MTSKKYILLGKYIISLCCILSAYGFTQKTEPVNAVNTLAALKDSSLSKKNNLNAAQIKFLQAYSKFIRSSDSAAIKLINGESFVWDDGKGKSFNQKLDNADINDMLSQQYIPEKNWDSPPATDFDPGRIRNIEFFKCIYGKSEAEVQKNCVSIDWFGKKIRFNKINGGADSLKAVISDLSLLNKDLRKYFTITAGTFMWRVIAGTKNLSMHSFALAIDINTAFSNYWRNAKNTGYKNSIPYEIVSAFEKHGFIWGGKWYHYDTMHFEFRPEFFN
jgi:hypothetical protein